MEPNDLPIVVLPLDLPGDSATILIDLLRDLTAALARRYAGQLLRRQSCPLRQPRSSELSAKTKDGDPRF